ncbi:uncharacterized protein LOC126737507 [Anthonomus grandis grandis]|uniref:uncharacterized protein LOC126737507 n=1 Tax=Anthonomus grandis grandis TaxID=2921223 RepID=UPI0021660237|nr:uncharacterized protein LOC126737507 [Anthonomus grandis grandis]XP_050298390.1 uncharacterized protein LOC126737507 [Anthonomus grandis grandis]XP_050298391.1 uncharacterized protein LOC126737507 [Anthonomus grandis grandis]XP_050298392.1 uncharacterized protein LOC126737507 [Anthonomus grandis grandis]
MNWDGDCDLEHDIQIYSELEVDSEPGDQFTIPKSIRTYEQRINFNNTASIFDTNHYLESLAKNENGSCSFTDVMNDNVVPNDFLDDEHTIKVSIGRGRGGRNTFYRPGDFSVKTDLGNDEALMQEIRKVNPVGYSNAIIEETVKAHHKKSSNKASPKKEIISPSSSSPVTTDSTRISTRDSDNLPIETVEPENKPLPITSLLKKTREMNKQIHLQRQIQALDSYNKREEEIASHRVIEEILRQDLEEAQRKSKGRSTSSPNSSSTSTLSSTSDGTPVSWSQRASSSSPAYQWKRPNDVVNIHSSTEFPPLK